MCQSFLSQFKKKKKETNFRVFDRFFPGERILLRSVYLGICWVSFMEVRAALCTSSGSACWDNNREATEGWDGFHVGTERELWFRVV